MIVVWDLMILCDYAIIPYAINRIRLHINTGLLQNLGHINIYLVLSAIVLRKLEHLLITQKVRGNKGNRLSNHVVRNPIRNQIWV